MSRQQFEIICDAPPYSVVRACSRIGLDKPEDVGWRETSRFLADPKSRSACGASKRNQVEARFLARDLVCSCGRDLPRMVEYRFFFDDGSQEDYCLGQCRQCQTVYWRHSTIQGDRA